MADEPKPTAQEEFRQFRRAVEPMAVCWACHYHVYPGTQSCPHCGANVPQHAAKRAGQLAELIRLKEELEAILARVEASAAASAKTKAKKKAASKKKQAKKTTQKATKKTTKKKATPRRRR